MIAGGQIDGEIVSSAYIVEIHFYPNCNMISEIIYKNVPDMAISNAYSFNETCGGRFVLGGGLDSNDKVLNDVHEVDGQEFKPLPRLNEARYEAGSCYINNRLYVCGGENNGAYLLDSIEMLHITTSDNAHEWELCETNLPCKVNSHTLTPFKGKIILIGGYVEGSISNKIWEGTLESKHDIKWKPMSPMQKGRGNHFSVVVDDNIYVFGGLGSGNVLCEVFDGREWKLGPSFSFSLSTWNAQVVVDRKKRIIITTNEHGIVIYDHIKATIVSNTEYKLKEKRYGFAALLL